MSDIHWETLEKEVKDLANAKWATQATARKINGIDHDCVLEKRPDYYIIIEISKSDTLDKLRGDVNRLNSTKSYLFSQGIYSECYFVCDELSEISSLRDTAKGHNITALSVQELINELFDYATYKNIRIDRNFGSDPSKNVVNYVDVGYIAEKNKIIFIDDMISILKSGKNIVLLGDFGTGKSRCIRELFNRLSDNSSASSRCYPIAINLRDSWGATRYEELISKHYIGLGVSHLTDITLRMPENNALFFLLDGFDEIGTQTWGFDPADIKAAKAASLSGVKDLIKKKKNGIIIVGREHYFNDDEEMFEFLGLRKNNTVICKCKQEFSDEEIKKYLESCKITIQYPEWLPKKPLLCEYINSFEPKILNTILNDSDGEIQFWNSFFEMLAERDSDITPMLSAKIVQKVLIELARTSRKKSDQMQPFSVNEIKDSFFRAAGKSATGESEIMLRRLPGLGRFDSQTDERKFVDRYIVNGLVAEDLYRIIEQQDSEALGESWVNEAANKSIFYTSEKLKQYSVSPFETLSRVAKKRNDILRGDILHITVYGCDNVDLKGVKIENSIFSDMDLSQKTINNLTISESFFSSLNISKTVSNNFNIEDSEIHELCGVSSGKGVPHWIKNCKIKNYVGVATKSDIRRHESLSIYQKHFLEIVQKVFFQGGSAKSERAIFKPADLENKKARDLVLRFLEHEKIIEKKPKAGRDGALYAPNRKFSPRLEKIKDELHHSTDEIWLEVSKLKSV